MTSVHIEGSEMLRANKSQTFKMTREDSECSNTIPNQAFNSQLPLGFISPTDALTKHPSRRKSCGQFGLNESYVEKHEIQAEEEAVHIPGQCC